MVHKSKIFILFILFSLCTPSESIENSATSTTEFIGVETTTTTASSDVQWANFLAAWEENLNVSPVLTNDELQITEDLLKLWEWQGDKYNLNQYLFEIQVNGLTCTRIYNSMGWALLDEVHPTLEDFNISHTYICDETGDLYLFGNPFYYQGNWWIYHNVEFDWDGFNCENPCGTYAPNYASRFMIESPLDVLNNLSNDSKNTIASDLNIEITNCPLEVVDIEVGDTFKVDFFVQAGSSDVTSIFYYFELNGEYYSRLPLDKENHSEFFDFPVVNQLTESATFVEKLADGDVYYIYIDVLDDESNSVSTECEVKF